jgi:hypothetical protein
MIKEFALEPDVLAASFRDFSYFIEKFGVAQGRVISRFPKDWKRMVYEAAQASLRGTKELSRIEIRLRAITDDVLITTGRPSGDGTQPWLTRAMSEHCRQPFAAIIARENPIAHTEVLVANDLDDSNLRFQAAGQQHITRTAAEIVDCVELLIGSSKKVKLIDPHFDPAKKRWRRMLELVLTELSSNGQAGVILEIHRSDKISSEHLKHIFDSCIPKFRPAGVAVQVFLHPDAAMHNRFILTSIGGASYNTGLDDNEEGGSTPTDLVSFLAPDIFATEWATYSNQIAFLVYA